MSNRWLTSIFVMF